MFEGFPVVPPEWLAELSQLVVLTLTDFRRGVADDEFAMLVVECRPPDGYISLSMLMTAEAQLDPSVATPMRISAWRHESLERKSGMWRLAAGVERVMQETYHCAAEPDRPAIATAFICGCAEAVASPAVTEELARFRRSPGFSVVHRDAPAS